MDLTPKSELVARTRELQGWMKTASVDAVFVFQNADLFYFSGTLQSGLFCLPACADPVYLVQKSLVRARQESPWEKLLPFPGFKKLPEWLAGEGITDLRRVGIETDVLPTDYYLRLKELFADTEFVDASGAIRRIRMCKSAHEIGQMREAARMLGAAFDRLPDWIRDGVTELEVMAKLEGCLRRLGHQGIVRMRGFNNQLGFGALSSGASASYPTPFPGPVGCEGLYAAAPGGAGRRKIRFGDTIIADIVGGYGGYLADKTRTYVLGELAHDLADAHRFVLDMNREIESMLRPGTVCSQIYRRALEMARESPYASGFMGIGDSQVRFIGHGIGLELDEMPVLAGGFDIALGPGMTIAVEPKVFFPERGGVGVENTYVITANGFEKLTEYPEEVIVI
jgi:Xaa-Pro dipeptidase